jgi:hypothetical protein
MALQLADTVCIPCRKESAYMHAENISSTFFLYMAGVVRAACQPTSRCRWLTSGGLGFHIASFFTFLIKAGGVEILTVLESFTPLYEC